MAVAPSNFFFIATIPIRVMTLKDRNICRSSRKPRKITRASFMRMCLQCLTDFPSVGGHLAEEKKFFFRITVLQATGIPRDFTDVFVQFK